MNKRILIAIFALAMLLTTHSASAILETLCTSSITGAGPGTLPSANIQILVSTSLLVVLSVLTVLGIVYAFGHAFNVESWIEFSQNEAVESLFNIVIIAMAAAGIGFAGAWIALVTNIGLSGLQNVNAQFTAYSYGTPSCPTSYQLESQCGDITTASGPCAISIPLGSQACPFATTASSATNAKDVYLAVCENYINNGVGVVFANVVPMVLSLYLLSTLEATEVDLMPWGVGINFTPFAGLGVIISVLENQLDLYFAVIMLYIVVSFLLIFIYQVFPLFFYVGLLLRAFPWSRAAGGTLLAIFIAFYIVFPALLYPFSISSSTINTALGTLGTNTGSLSGWLSSTGALLASLTVLQPFGGPLVVNEIQGFASELGVMGIQLLGVLIAFVVSLDLVEALGDILGAPSLHTKGLFEKVV